MHPETLYTVDADYDIELMAEHLVRMVYKGSMTTDEAFDCINKLNACGTVNAATVEEVRDAVIDDEIESVRRDPLLNWFQKHKRIKELKRRKRYGKN